MSITRYITANECLKSAARQVLSQQMKTSRHQFRTISFLFLIFVVRLAFGGSPSFPVSAGQRGTVTCLEHPYYTYDIYLPPAYSNAAPLPIFYTMYASGGGMVSTFTNACSNLNVIVVGITGSKNGMPWDNVLREIYAVTLDVRHRVRYDPTAEFAGGESGGGECAYMFSRMRAQHVAGLFEMAGWLARYNMGSTIQYYGIDRVQTNLLVVRTTGTNTSNPDTGSIFYNPFDSNYLAHCGAVIQDFYFDGGHGTPPESLKIPCLSWLLDHRTPSGPDDESNALAQAADWQSRIVAGQEEAVVHECVSNLMNFPRTWYALEAELTLDELMTNFTVFRTLDVSNLAQGDFAYDMFYYYARGAATNADWTRHDSCLKALTGINITNDYNGTITISNITETVAFPTTNGMIFITTTNGDRAGDIYSLITNFNPRVISMRYPRPILHALSAPSNQVNLWIVKDLPGLDYTVQLRTNIYGGAYRPVTVTAVETNTTWSATYDLASAPDHGFFRIRTVPSPAVSPPWPAQ